MHEIKVITYNPLALDEDAWRELQTLERNAFASVLVNRDKEEIDALVGWDDPKRYMMSHIDPNSEVGRRYNAHQSFDIPRVAIATTTGSDEILGFAYSANNVSGANELIRQAKKLSVAKNYLWLREIAVKPEHQQLGIAKYLGKALLERAKDTQPVTAYVWPDAEPSFIQETLLRIGFLQTGEQFVKIFGEDSDPVKQVRMQAPSVRSVLDNL